MNSLKTNIRTFLQNTFLGNSSASVYSLLTILWKKLITFDIDQRAAAVSYSFMLAVFPGVIFLFTLIPYIPIKHLDHLIMDFLQEVMPKTYYESVSETILEVVSRPRGDILSFGFLFAMFAATNGMSSLIRAFNMALEVREKRTYLQARWIALLLTALLIFIQLTAIIFLIIGQIMIDILLKKGLLDADFIFYVFQTIRYGVIFLIFLFGICLIYYFGPAVKQRIRFFNYGAFISSILCILATNLFSYYISNFNSYNRIYGSIGTLIGLMVWIYLIALLLIFGFEINMSLRDVLGTDKTKMPHQSSGGGISYKP
jgi:membrane protein